MPLLPKTDQKASFSRKRCKDILKGLFHLSIFEQGPKPPQCQEKASRRTAIFHSDLPKRSSIVWLTGIVIRKLRCFMIPLEWYQSH